MPASGLCLGAVSSDPFMPRTLSHTLAVLCSLYLPAAAQSDHAATFTATAAHCLPTRPPLLCLSHRSAVSVKADGSQPCCALRLPPTHPPLLSRRGFRSPRVGMPGLGQRARSSTALLELQPLHHHPHHILHIVQQKSKWQPLLGRHLTSSTSTRHPTPGEPHSCSRTCPMMAPHAPFAHLCTTCQQLVNAFALTLKIPRAWSKRDQPASHQRSPH